jgi:hypothetical protein
MDTNYAYLIVLIVLIFVSLFFIQKLLHQIEILKSKPVVKDNTPLILSAYERLALFAERNKLDNLITKLYQNNYSAKEMQAVMVNNIKEEYDYNISQQLYIKPEIWAAVTKMKEQNVFILNQISNTLPPTATAMDFNKQVLELLNTNENVTMNNVVLDVIQFEAKSHL